MTALTDCDTSLIPELLRPDAFPHATDELQLLETHISWVILTGQWAYKIKKPVRFDFVDYSTLERRKEFCELELVLNRRLAPDLYDSVVSIVEMDGRLQFVEPHQAQELDESVVEYAVRMRQFPQEAIASVRLHDSTMTATAVEQFGRDVARFHGDLESAPPTLPCVQSERILSDALGNFRQLDSAFVDDPRHRLLCELECWTRREFHDLEVVFRQRLEGGFVRYCHGDMHLKNIIQLNGKLIAYDGIEFNDEFQWIDVMSEIAFPVMDFMARGRPDLGWRLLNAWLESNGDYTGLRILDFYLVYRAMVRAKVAWLNPANHVGEDSTDPSSGSTVGGSWDRYLSIARHLAFEVIPSLTITHGLSGSGKSTAAMAMIDREGGIRIRSDVERLRLTVNDSTATRYSPQMTGHIYDLLKSLAKVAISAGFPVIVDATFLHRQHRADFARLADELNVVFAILECDAPVEELRRRIASRQGDPSEATFDVLEQQIANREPLTNDELLFARSPGED